MWCNERPLRQGVQLMRCSLHAQHVRIIMLLKTLEFVLHCAHDCLFTHIHIHIHSHAKRASVPAPRQETTTVTTYVIFYFELAHIENCISDWSLLSFFITATRPPYSSHRQRYQCQCYQRYQPSHQKNANANANATATTRACLN